MAQRRIEPVRIDDLDDPRAAPYRNVRDAHLRGFIGPGQEGLFMAEGALVVEHLIRSDFSIHSLLVAEPRLAAIEPMLRTVPQDVPILVASRDVMNDIVGFNIHRGLLAAGIRRSQPSLEGVMADADVLLVLVGLSNHDNVGAIFRNVACLAGGRGAVLLDETSCDPLYRKALRVSMGHALHIPFGWTGDAVSALHDVRAAGFSTVALTPSPGADPVARTRPGDRLAFVLGAEGPGLADHVAHACDQRMRIPMTPGVDSLNVATAAALALDRLGFVHGT